MYQAENSLQADNLILELSDSSEIAALLEVHQPPKRVQAPPRSHSSKSTASLRRCKCGNCSTCLENARWDKIFNEKFADPNYYKPKPVRHTSSLGWLR